MRYTDETPLSATLPVRFGLFGAPRVHFVTLHHGVLQVHAARARGAAHEVRLCDSRGVDVDTATATTTIRSAAAERCVSLRFVESEQHAVWTAALRRAHARRLDRFYALGAAVGRGHFATVRLARDVRTGERVAVKTVWKPGSSATAVRREAALARSLRGHENVVRFLDVFETDVQLHLVMELVPGGDLYDLLESSKHHTEALARRVVAQLLAGLVHLHDAGVVHRDVKPENVLLDADLCAKLADFGLSRRLARASGSVVSDAGSSDEEGCVPGSVDGSDSDDDTACSELDHSLRSAVGTPAFCAPEIVRRRAYGRPVDVFALGVLACVAMTGSSPFEGCDARATLRNVVDDTRHYARRWSDVSDAARDFVERLTAHEPDERPTARAALRHPWLVGGVSTVHTDDDDVVPVVDARLDCAVGTLCCSSRISSVSHEGGCDVGDAAGSVESAHMEEMLAWM